MRARKPTKAQNDAAELLPDPEAVDKLTTFFDSLGNGREAAVQVYAVDPSNRLRRSFLFTIADAAELTGPELMAQVLEKYGAGEYHAQSADAETGQIVFSQRFEVGALGKRGAVIPSPPASQTPAPAKPGDISAELVAMMQRQTAALEALARREQPTLISMLRDLKELRDVIAPAAPAAPAFDLGKLLELVNGVATLRDTLGDGGGEGGPLAVLARSLAPALTKIAERAVDAPAVLPAPRPIAAPPAAGVTDSPPATPPAEGADVGASSTMLKIYVAELVRFAEQGLEPQAATQRVLQTLAGFPESTIAAVLDWLNDEAAVANLAAIEPKAAQYAAWLEKVIDGVLDAALEPADETPPATPPANGAAQPSAGG